ncbi:hypothetical protein [Streptomyces sp. VB1]|uniref:hypothetical protein n=1 Tax=Streptomyces sp. VB1 TaxID=2986803 RepID=UPI002241EEBF|nr:hypothetical protein [Streptomyces sp. VB1]UZI26640.1 beta-lactamase family protein [Streptomyces sp. VB1]
MNPLNRSVRTLLATALVLGIVCGAAGPVSASAPADAAAASRPAASGAPRAQTLRTPGPARGDRRPPAPDAVAALVRVGGTGGSWRGSAGVHDLPSAGRGSGGPLRAGSVTKVFTAATVLQLAGERKLSLTAPPGTICRPDPPRTARSP